MRPVTPLTLDRVIPCTCGTHSMVRLRSSAGTRVHVRVSQDYAVAIAARGQGVASVPAGIVDAMIACSEATGAVPVQLLLPQGSEHAFIQLRVESGDRDTFVPVDPGAGILVACHLGLTLTLSWETPSTGVSAAPRHHEAHEHRAQQHAPVDDGLSTFRDALDDIEWFEDDPS